MSKIFIVSYSSQYSIAHYSGAIAGAENQGRPSNEKGQAKK